MYQIVQQDFLTWSSGSHLYLLYPLAFDDIGKYK